MIMLALFVAAALIRLAIMGVWHFDGLYGQDAFAYYQQALAITERLPPPADFFWPNGYPVLAALFMAILGRHEYAAQFASVFCGAALAPLAYVLSRDLLPGFGHRVGLWAGAIMVVAGQPLLSSIVIMADMPALFWATLSCWLLVRAWNVSGDQRIERAFDTPLDAASPVDGRLHRRYLFWAGLALGLAVVTRWLYALLALPWGAYALLQSRSHKTPRWVLLLPTLGGLTVLLPQVWLSLNRPQSLLHSWLLNWRFSNFSGRHFEHIDGQYTYALPVGIYYLQPLAHPNYLVPVLGLAAVWGGWHLWRTRSWGPLLLLGGWSGVVYLFLAGIPYENFRFALTLYLPLVVLAGVGIESLRHAPPSWVMHRLGRPGARRVWVRGLYTVMVASLVVMALWALRSADRFLTAQNQTKETARAIEARLPTDATVLSFGLTLTLQHYTHLNVVELYDLDEAELAAETSIGSPVYLLLDLDNVAQQWQDRPPQLNYEWLQQHRRLMPVEEFPPHSLFQITTTDHVTTSFAPALAPGCARRRIQPLGAAGWCE